MATNKKKSVAEIISKLADLEAEIDIMKSNKDKYEFSDKEIKSLQNKFYKLSKKLENMPDDSKNESLELIEDNEKLEEAKKRKINRKIRINEDKDSFTTVRINDPEKIKELYEDNAFVLLGVDTSDSNLEALINALKEEGHIKNEVTTLYIIKGALLNDMLNTSDFKSSLNIVAIKEEDLDKIENLKNSTMYQLSVCTNWMKNLLNGFGDVEYIFENKEDEEDEELEEIEESKIVEDVENIVDQIDLYSGMPQYINTNEGYMEVKFDTSAPAPEEWDEGFLPENGGDENELEEARSTYNNGQVIALIKLPEDELFTYIYTDKEFEDILKQLEATKVDVKEFFKK